VISDEQRDQWRADRAEHIERLRARRDAVAAALGCRVRLVCPPGIKKPRFVAVDIDALEGVVAARAENLEAYRRLSKLEILQADRAAAAERELAEACAELATKNRVLTYLGFSPEAVATAIRLMAVAQATAEGGA
jgi:hypothetical protein